MKKIILSFIVFAFLANVSAQLKVDASGQVLVGSSIGTISNVPLTFKVNNSLVGFTGSSVNSNVSFGYGSLSNPLTGNYNVAIGSGALYANTGSYNTANGYQALFSNTTGTWNTANGYRALYANTSGGYNTANGYQALYSNSTSLNNTANGYQALYYNTVSNNTANGARALYSNTTGGYNTANGNRALYSNTTGSYNTVNGDHALFNNTTGNENTAIGCNTDVSVSDMTNATAIGYGVIATASYQVRIGNTTVNSIGGYAPWSNLSDGRAKKNMKADVPGLAFINRLQPITYNLDLDAIDVLLKIDKTKKNDGDMLSIELPQELKEKEKKARETKEKQVQTGFVAQDVEQAAKSIGYDFSGVEVDELGIYGLRYSEFVVPLVKAVQELSAQNEQLQQQINELKGNGAALRSSSNETGTTGVVNPEVAQCKLYQNAPNPFTHSTEIKYYLPDNVSKALLCIYNLQGRELKQMNVSGHGEGSQMIHGHELPAGMYLYALIVDGSVVDTKKMILTK